MSASQLATLGNFFFFCNFLLKDFGFLFYFSPGSILQWKNPIFQLPLCMAPDRAPSPKPTVTRPQKLFSKKQLKGKKKGTDQALFFFLHSEKACELPRSQFFPEHRSNVTNLAIKLRLNYSYHCKTIITMQILIMVH